LEGTTAEGTGRETGADTDIDTGDGADNGVNIRVDAAGLDVVTLTFA
jgi:hypothetical protein